MEKQPIPLTYLSYHKKARIITIDGGHGFRRKLHVLGIREGQLVTIVSKQPLRGPLTIAVGKSQMTLGRGMASKILVEEL